MFVCGSLVPSTVPGTQQVGYSPSLADSSLPGDPSLVLLALLPKAVKHLCFPDTGVANARPQLPPSTHVLPAPGSLQGTGGRRGSMRPPDTD